MNDALKIWVLLGEKEGDNQQVIKAADSLNLEYQTKQIVLDSRLANKRFPIYDQVERSSSSALRPPWPDLILVIGRRLSRVALWVKKLSGSRARVVLFNAPKGSPLDFDLSVLPFFYSRPEHPRVCTIQIPLIGKEIGQQGESGSPDETSTVVLCLGGSIGLWRLTPGRAAHIYRAVVSLYGNEKSVFITTSRRTHPRVAQRLKRMLRSSDQIYAWGSGELNPYADLVRRHQHFVVTGDSVSMLVELIRSGKRVNIADTSNILSRSIRKLTTYAFQPSLPSR